MSASKSRVVLKAVKKIVVQFCPFESNVRSAREFLTRVGSEKARSTNLNCEVTTLVKHDRSEPTIDIIFIDGDRLLMKGANLTSAEMLSSSIEMSGQRPSSNGCHKTVAFFFLC